MPTCRTADELLLLDGGAGTLEYPAVPHADAMSMLTAFLGGQALLATAPVEAYVPGRDIVANAPRSVACLLYVLASGLTG